MSPSSRHTAPTVDAYLAKLDASVRAALERLRAVIRKAGPDLEECINHGVPSYRIDGRHTVSFGAAAKHCAFYPGAVVEDYAGELRAFSTSKGTIRFPANQPIPARLIRAMVGAQIARRRLARAGQLGAEMPPVRGCCVGLSVGHCSDPLSTRGQVGRPHQENRTPVTQPEAVEPARCDRFDRLAVAKGGQEA